MSLVGDIILELRSRIPDAPSVVNLPYFTAVSTYNDPNGAFPPNSQVSLAVTSTNSWGETGLGGGVNQNPSFVRTVTLGPSDNAVQATIANVPPPYSNFTNVYLAATATTDPAAFFPRISFPAQQLATYQFTGNQPLPPGGVLTITNAPIRNTAFHPDTDGNFIGAYTAFRLLNRAISEMVKIAGGIIDVTGVQSHVNQSMYRIDSPNGQGSFYQFVNAWFDGYPMDVVQRSMMYLRNSAAGFSGILSYEQDGPSSVIQVWPQSNRTGGSSVLAQNMNATQNNFGVADGTGFLSIGLAQIDEEIVAFSQVTNEPGVSLFQGVTRGLAGTLPATHNQDAPVTELNIRLSGYRMPPIYEVGQSAQTLMVPQAWETPLVLHMLSQVRSMEQDDAAAKSLQGDFVQMAEKIAKGSRLGKLKPRQISVWGQTGSDARNVNGIGFGWLIQ